MTKLIILFNLGFLFQCQILWSQPPAIKVLVVASADHDHNPMILRSRSFFEDLAKENNYTIVFSRDTSLVNKDTLAKYQVFIQLQLAPFDMSVSQQQALQQFITQGKGWIGVHAAGLTGKGFLKPGMPYWQWFENMMGNVIYSPHPRLQTGQIILEDTLHPVLQGLPSSFYVKDEWYEWDHSPRAKVHVLARANEATYTQNKPMGDHPMMWTNPEFNRVLYICFGHDSSVCSNVNFKRLIKNAIQWAASPVSYSKDTIHGSPLTVLVNQMAYDLNAPKIAVVQSNIPLIHAEFEVLDTISGKIVYKGLLGKGEEVTDWFPGVFYHEADFSSFKRSGIFRIVVPYNGKEYLSYDFKIEDNAISKMTIPAIINFFRHQRASSPEETEADRHVLLLGSDKTVDMHGGWCDASGDVSKYFSHLAYTNFMLPQQIPLVTWSFVYANDKLPTLLKEINSSDAMRSEALYGADYLMRSLSSEGYFYMTLFSYFNKDPNARRVVGLLADSKTTSDYQCAFREGGGMAIAALARISRWGINGDYTSGQYLEAAEKAFKHLLVNNTRYDDDGKENIIDDYCALMAASELWAATSGKIYMDEARKRAKNLSARLSHTGYFIANDNDRPFWHASDAGLPILALTRYLECENDEGYRNLILKTIKKFLDYQLKVTEEVPNPFGYPRQSFLFKGEIKDGFFIPHENESGWWWQGEDARLASLTCAVILGGRLVYPGKAAFGVDKRLAEYVSRMVAWILGCNPYNICMMYGYGHINVPYMSSMYGHGTGKGGISNGITGKKGMADGSGIDFKIEDNGNEWRWSEQWIPHSAWFLLAVTAMAMK